MRQTDTIIIGAGQAGLAMSHCLSELGIEHVVLERGQVAQRWRSERWDSLRLLTPNWMSRLPGWHYRGTDPDGFMTMPEVTAYFEQYAGASSMPVVSGVTVSSVRRGPSGYIVETDNGVWHGACVVIATGHCDVPLVPDMARWLPESIRQVTPSGYRNPAQLSDGGVLIVGASATGVQLAEEMQRSGRQVTLAVGRHIRLPRCYRGQDIMAWLEQTCMLQQRAEVTTDLRAARGQPSMQLVGRADHANIDLGVLRDSGVRVVGRATDIRDGVVHIKDDLQQTVAASQARLARLLTRIDATADAAEAPAEAWPAGLTLDASPATIDLADQHIRTIVWATGFKRDYRWLHVPVLDGAGEIIHAGGITPSPGLYALGLRFLRRRNSSFIDGVGADAAELAEAIQRRLTARVAA